MNSIKPSSQVTQAMSRVLDAGAGTASPACAPGSNLAPAVAAADLAHLRTAIDDASKCANVGPHSEAALAIDFLINLAVRPGAGGSIAQAELRSIYASETTHPAIRQELSRAAHAMCKWSFTLGIDTVPLSPTVAYFATRCSNPPGGAGFYHDIEHYLANELPPDWDSETSLVAPNRMVTGHELAAACSRLTTLEVQPQPIVMHDTRDDGRREIATQFNLMAQQALERNAPVAAWVHSGADSFQHWLPVVAQPVQGGGIQWHVLNTAADTPGGQRVGGRLLELLPVGHKITPHVLSQEHTPNACGPLGFMMLAALDARLRGQDAGLPADDLGIAAHLKQLAGLSVENQQAAVDATRAGLIEAAVAAGELPWTEAQAIHLEEPAAAFHLPNHP